MGWEMVLRLLPWRHQPAPKPTHLTHQPLLSSCGCQASPATAEGHPERRWVHGQQKLWPPNLDPRAGPESVADARL